GELPVLLADAMLEAGRPAGSFADNPQPSADLPSRRVSRHHAWVQVMTGCTNFCSYCIVPHVRGPERSRPPGEVAEEVRRLVDDGVVEITLLGQNVNAYGQDQSFETGFDGLLEVLNGVEGIERIRFTTSHPKDLDESLITAIRDLPAVCEHLHLPAQSGSTKILGRMNRSYTREHYLGLVDRLCGAIPGLALTTDLIVGFPGEQEEDFNRTLTLVERCRFDGAFTFRHSPRPGTAAAGMPGVVPEVTIKRRMRELVQAVQETAAEKNDALAGTCQEVMVEGDSRQGGGQIRGRTRGNKIVNFLTPGGVQPPPGEIVMVEISSSTSTTLKGQMRPRQKA
ncbi:MAG: MiaB/RimO family radical SAM methylthiotransferase, partial [Thermoleophilia bacterium]|nr:MiaB/RimO family radical SAM methylthiotransferase [Thermoleophilia bacterium]